MVWFCKNYLTRMIFIGVILLLKLTGSRCVFIVSLYILLYITEIKSVVFLTVQVFAGTESLRCNRNICTDQTAYQNINYVYGPKI